MADGVQLCRGEPVSVRGAPTEGGGRRGYDIGKKVMGRKRHAMVDGRGLVLQAHSDSVQHRDGAPPLLSYSTCRTFRMGSESGA